MEAHARLALWALVIGFSSALVPNTQPMVVLVPSNGRYPVCPAGLREKGGLYPGLFKSTQDLQAIKSGVRVSCGRLSPGNYAVLSTYRASCQTPRARSIYEAVGQDTCNYVATKGYSPCCQTNFQLVQPHSVTSVFGQKFTVRHYEHSVQVTHVGTCSSANSPCSNGGQCVQEYRIEWILVVGSPDSFIPVEMPNHCVCVYT